MSLKSAFKGLFAATSLLAVLATPAAAAEYNLRLSHMFTSSHFVQQLVLEPWAKSIEEKSDGRVKIQIFSSGSAFGDASRQFDQVRGGTVDIAVGIPAIPRGRHPLTTLIELPFTVATADAGTRALMDIYDDYLKDDFPGTIPLSLTVTQPSAIHTREAISDISEVKGLRLRAPTPSVTAMLNELGATPVGLPPTQIYENVERGVVDGNVMPWGPVGAFKLYEVLKHHLNAGVDTVSMYTLMNKKRYDSLPPDIQKLFDDSVEYFTENWGQWWADTDQVAIDAAREAGNTITDVSEEQRDEWRSSLQSVIDDYLAEQEKEKPGSIETYKAMQAALEKYQ